MKIFVKLTDHLDPEVNAMLQAMYSRTYASIESRLPKTEEEASSLKDKLRKFYLEWGHKSVGQLGSTTVWIEGVSQLAAKAIENTPLFNGQESSTRYIDFSTQPFVHTDSTQYDWQEKFRSFYIKAMPILIEHLKSQFPFANQYDTEALTKDAEDKRLLTYNNTIRARAFDILRGVLPAGATTNVVFSGTFDLINDHFGEMLFHPLEECRQIANTVLSNLKDVYPDGIESVSKLEERFSHVTTEHFYDRPIKSLRDLSLSEPDYPLRANRKKFERLPLRYVINQIKTLSANLDFGSFRDLHRHRRGSMIMPLLSTELGFHPYYLDNLPKDLREALVLILKNFEDDYGYSNWSTPEEQYVIPMGYQVPVSYTCDLNQVLYILELRSSKTVHQTLRQVVLEWYKQFKAAYPYIEVHVDKSEDNFSLKRGTQTFNSEFKA